MLSLSPFLGRDESRVEVDPPFREAELGDYFRIFVIRPKSAASANSFNIPSLEVYDDGMSTEIANPLSLPILTAYFSQKKGNGSCHKK